MKNVIRRFLSLALVLLMTLTLLPVMEIDASAATSGDLTGLSDSNIGASYTGDADDAWSARGNTISGNVTRIDNGVCKKDYETTLTMTNKKTVAATLSFDYTIAQNSGTIQVAGNAVTANGSYSGELAPGGSIEVYLKSGSAEAATSISITNLALISDVSATTTFLPAENGSYTVDGVEITAETSKTKQSTEAYTLVATPASGYKFFGWYSVTDNKYLSSDATDTLNFDSNQTIKPVFIDASLAIFETGGVRFYDLNEANNYAAEKGQDKIVLLSDGTLPSDAYTISSDITLVIPFDASGTLYTTTPEIIRTTSAAKAYRTLTMAEGSSITVNGAISIGGRYFAPAGNEQGRIVGDYGYIKMAANSSITVENGGALYAWGFISGSGSVLAKSGASVYEYYQIADFRGGSASTTCISNNVFPFSQYFVQNVEVPLTLNAGAKEVVYSGAYALNSTKTTSINFIGDNGMFKVISGSLTKDYDEKTDRLIITVDGDAELNSLVLKLADMRLDSSKFVLPITNNITININSGKVTINQDTALLAGVQVNIADGADLIVAEGKNVYLYDSDEWNSDSFVWGNCKFKSVNYAPGKMYSRTSADLKDVKMDVNGSITAIGALYTTNGGADICSGESTGKYIQMGAPGTKTETHQYNSSSQNIAIPITPAKLHNADGSYTATANAKADDTFSYKNGKWGVTTYTVTWVNDDGTVLETDEDVAYGTTPSYDGATPTKANDAQYSYTFKGWDPAVSEVTGDVTYKAVYEQTVNKYTVTWKNWDGTVLSTDDQVEYGTVPNYGGETPTKAGDAQYSYSFSGWTPEITAVTGDAEYTATFTNSINTYTVTWVNWDKTELEKDEDVAYGTVPSYDGETPSRAGDAQYSYTFKGWAPTVDNVTGDITYTAVFEQTVNRYTITWKNGDTVLKTEKVAYGETPVYSGATPTKAGNAQYSYAFSGWTPELSTVTGDVTYTAVYEQTVNKYTVTWKNWDGTVLSTDQVEYGTVPSYGGETPTKAGDAQYSYSFSGWTPEITAVTGDVTYTAQFEQKHKDGWFTEDNGKTYYENGVIPYHGEWAQIGGNTYYFNGDGYIVTGINQLTKDGVEGRYIFDSNGVFQGNQNGLYDVGADTYWTENGMIVEFAGLVRTVDANGKINYYYFESDGKAVKAPTGETVNHKVDKNNDLPLPAFNYAFDEKGIIVHDEDTSKNGICEGDGSKFYYIDGVKVGMGLIEIDGSYYYARTSSGEIVRDRTYWISQNNGLPIETGMYYFGADGKLVPNGFVEINGVAYYYENGVKAKGFTKIAEDYYFFNAGSGKMYKDTTLWVGNNNYGIADSWFEFGTDGKMIKTGFVTGASAKDTSTYYHDETVLAKGFTKIGEDYYFFNAGSGKMYKSITLWVGANDYGITGGYYYFGEDGKMLVPDLENGTKAVVSENGKLYFTIDGAKMTNGLYELNGEYYYAKSNSALAANETVWVSNKNGLIPAKGNWYAFDAEGKLIKTGFVTGGDGYTYYYDNAVLALGFTKIGDDYYMFNAGSGKLYKDANMWVGANGYGIEGGYYYFDADGKMST